MEIVNELFLFQYFVVEYAMYNDESPKKSNKSWTGKPKYGLTKGNSTPSESIDMCKSLTRS